MSRTENFLRERGVAEEELEKLRKDKIDDDVILLMKDAELSKYICKYGDRIALLAFLKSSYSPCQEKKTEVLKAVSKKIEDNGTRPKDIPRGKWLKGNRHAKREKRRIEVGWFNYMFDKKEFKQVKSPKGGGIRHYSFNESTTMEEVLQEAKTVFFPNGNSQQGKEHLFTFGIVDFNLNAIDLSTTVVQMYEKQKVKLVRVYMTTKKTNEISDVSGQSSDDDFAKTDTPPISFRKLNSEQANKMTNTTMRKSQRRQRPQPSDSILPQELHSETEFPDVAMSAVSPEKELECNQDSCNTTMSVEETIIDILPYSPSPPSEIACLAPLSEEQTQVTLAPASTFTSSEDIIEFNLEGFLKWWKNKTLLSAEDPIQIVVLRANLMKSTLRIVRRQNFNFCLPFKVVFSGEDGDDQGGPKREFFCLLLKEVCSSVFQGEDNKKFFLHSIEKLSNNMYELAGKLVAYSLLHGGPGIPVMHPFIFKMIIGEDSDVSLPSVEECIFDVDTRQKLIQLQNVLNEADYKKALCELTDWCFELGLSVHNFPSIKDKERLLSILKKNEICYRVQAEIDQFQMGLNSVGNFLEVMKIAPIIFEPLFVWSGDTLQFSTLRSLYKINWSEDGSNNRMLEENALYCFEAFLADCEGGSTGILLRDVLSFWTGSDCIPPMGFEKPLEITFGAIKQLPTAHTCGLLLSIWRGFDDPDVFEEFMVKAVKWNGGFHLA